MAWPRAAPGLPGGAGQRPLQGVDLRALVLHLGRPVVELLLRLGRLLQGGGGRALAGRGVTVMLGRRWKRVRRGPSVVSPAGGRTAKGSQQR